MHEAKDSEFEICYGDTLTNALGILRELDPAEKPALAGYLAAF